MPKASELKRGMVVDINGHPHVVKQLAAKSPSSRGAATLYKVRFNNVKTGQKLDESYKGDDFLQEAEVIRKQVQLSYRDGEGQDADYVFMDIEDFTQYNIAPGDIEEEAKYITDSLEGITVILFDGTVLGLELPASVNLEVIETAPAIKGATAAGRTKPATLSTGIDIQVPEYLESGEIIKVNTGTGKFMSRA